MRGGSSERKLFRVVNSKEAEIHVGNDVGRRRSFRRRIDTPVATAKRQGHERGDQKKTDFQTLAFHGAPLSNEEQAPPFQHAETRARLYWADKARCTTPLDVGFCAATKEPAGTASQRTEGRAAVE